MPTLKITKDVHKKYKDIKTFFKEKYPDLKNTFNSITNKGLDLLKKKEGIK